MVAGITVFSDANTIQIDDRYDTYGLTNKFMITDFSGVIGNLTALTPVTSGNAINIGGQSADIQAFEFKKASATANDSFGLEVFNADGISVYHSSKKPLRILDFVRIPTQKDGSINLAVVSKNYPNVGRIGVVIGNIAQIFASSGFANKPTFVFRPSIKITGNAVDFNWWRSDFPAEVNFYTDTICDYLVVDLTNY